MAENEEEVPTDDELRGEESTPESVHQETEESRGPQPGPSGKMVPYEAMAEERGRRKDADAANAEWEEKYNRLASRTDQLASWVNDQQQRQTKEEEEVQKFFQPQWDDNDPQAQRDWLESRFQKIEEPINGYMERIQQQDQRRAVEDRYQQDFARFSSGDEAKAAEINGGMQHWMNTLQSYYRTAGAPPERAQELVARDYHAIVVQAAQRGRNAAETIYEAARTFGYQPKLAEQTAEQQIDQINNGQAAARSLSNAGGKPPTNLTAEVVANMSDEEFEQLTDAQFKAVAG